MDLGVTSTRRPPRANLWRKLQLLGAVLSYSTFAQAYHTEDDRQTDFSAFTLRRNQYRVGLFQQEAGITNWLTVGTYTVPWFLIPFSGEMNGDVYAKLKLVDLDGFALSFRATYFFLKLTDLKLEGSEDNQVNASIMPLNATASYVFDRRWTASLDLAYVYTIANAIGNSDEISNVLGVGLQQTFQTALVGEYRVNRVFALNLVTRYVPWARSLKFDTSTEVGNGDTSVSIEGQVEGAELQHSWLIQPGATFSWSRFNFQFGLGYGDIFVPGLRLVAKQKFVVPDLDVYFRF